MPTVLLVDDQSHIIELAQLYFVRDGFEVLRATDGEQAIELSERMQRDKLGDY